MPGFITSLLRAHKSPSCLPVLVMLSYPLTWPGEPQRTSVNLSEPQRRQILYVIWREYVRLRVRSGSLLVFHSLGADTGGICVYWHLCTLYSACDDYLRLITVWGGVTHANIVRLMSCVRVLHIRAFPTRGQGAARQKIDWHYVHNRGGQVRSGRYGNFSVYSQGR